MSAHDLDLASDTEQPDRPSADVAGHTGAVVSHDPEEPAEPDQAGERPQRAVLYLRVSSPSQVKTDYDPEGISIPAQREACQRKAEQIGAEVVEEYVEPGRSATSMAKRVVFQSMLERIKTERDIDYVIVYKLSRLNRNRIEDGMVVLTLQQHGVALVSATEHIDDTPTGQLMHGILAAFNQFRSAEDGADISYKMGAKARKGGTLGRAPLGYLNQRDRSEGRNIGTVAIDPERGSLVRLAFELYATGDYTIDELAEALAERGLRTRPGRHPIGPVSTSKLGSMLADRYYIGYVSYKGEEFVGKHPPLISRDLFEQVQAVREQRSGAGVRQRRHHHYLKGMLWCGACHDQGRESRMIIQRAVGRRGGEYFYFFCRARQEGVCASRYVNVELVEDAVAAHYWTIRFTPEFMASVHDQVSQAVEDESSATRLLKEHLEKEVARLDLQEENLLDLVADGDVTSGKARERIARIRRQRSHLEEQMDRSGDRLDAGAELIRATLDLLLARPERIYHSANPEDRRLLNGAIFERLYVYEDTVTEHVLQPVISDLVEAQELLATADARKGLAKVRPGEDQAGGRLLAAALVGGGSSKGVMVGDEGLEPPTSSV